MNCVEIVKKYLIEGGYDGLHHDAECGCELSDLAPCGESFSMCRPGYKVNAPDSRYEYDWWICDSRDDRPWEV